MFNWEDKEQFTDIDEMADEIEEIGDGLRQELNAKSMVLPSENGRFFFKHSKVWEIPFACAWIDRLAAHLQKDTLKIMDFGCCVSPLPPYLARRGHTVWGVDDDSWSYIRNYHVADHFSDVHYRTEDVNNIQEMDFDAVISLSVFEHIHPDGLRVDLMNRFKGMLTPEGKQMHIVDFYFPEKPGKENERMDFDFVGAQMGWDTGEPRLCPGAPQFVFEGIRNEIRFVRAHALETRIATGDDF